MIAPGRLVVALIAALASSFIFSGSALAGVTSNQTVTYDTGTMTWTGGANNNGNPSDDSVVVTEDSETAGTVTVHTTDGSLIFITGDTPVTDPVHCTGDATDTVTCTGVSQFNGNANEGNDSVDASGLLTVPASLSADPSETDNGVDTLKGGAANDTLTSLSGDDTLDGNAGNDSIYGGDGADTIDAGDGDDTVYGGNAGDSINGGIGDDHLYGGAIALTGPTPTDGADTINGGDGNDYISGQDGNDILNGDDGIDEIHGGNGDDQIDGGLGDDASHFIFCCYSISGGLYGDAGNDTINGGEGIDFASGGDGSDTINGGAGDDSWFNGCYGPFRNSPKDAASSPSADLCWSSIDGGLYGNGGDDTVHGDDGNDYIGGNWGNYAASVPAETDNDHLYGDAGYDYVQGDEGDDVMDGGTQDDIMYGSAGNDTMNGGDGSDYVNGEAGDDIVNGNAGDDSYYGWTDEGPQVGLFGGDGNDQIDGGPGIDYAEGGDGNDTINGGDGRDAVTFVDCPAANVTANVNICKVQFGGLNGNAGDDTMNGGAGDDYVSGGDGNDNVDGGPGNDKWDVQAAEQSASGFCYWCYGSDFPGVYGDNGDDTVHGGDGSDYVSGGNGVDNTNGDAGDDNIDEWDDNAPDVAHGGDGIDHIWYYACCDQPVNITLNDQADDGETPASDTELNPGDLGNNFGSDIENVQFETQCTGDTFVCAFDSNTNGAPATIVGTSGPNLIWGDNGNDDITGGDGADYLAGGAPSSEGSGSGDDTFHARDGYPDYIDCMDGTDTAIVDQFDTVHNCENVDRANVPSAFDTSKPPVVIAQNPPVKPPSDEKPPQLNLTVPKTTFTVDQLVAGVRVSFSCNEDCALNLRLLAQQSSGSATFSRVKGYNVVVGRRSVGFGKSKRNLKVRPCERKQGGPQSQACLKRFKKAINQRLKKSGKVTMKLRAVTTDRAGNRSTKVKTITIKKPRK